MSFTKIGDNKTTGSLIKLCNSLAKEKYCPSDRGLNDMSPCADGSSFSECIECWNLAITKAVMEE